MKTHTITLGLLLALSLSACDKKSTSKATRDDDESAGEEDKKKGDSKSADEKSADKPGGAPSASNSAPPRAEKPTPPSPPPATAAAPPADALLAGYTPYTTAAGGYELMMPAGAKEEEHKLKSGTIQHRVRAKKGPGQTLMAYWQELEGEGSPQVLAAARDAAVNLMDAPKVTPVKVGGHDGFDVSGKPKTGDNKVMHMRMFLTKKRMYGMIDTDLSDAEAKAWMNWFKFTDGAATAGSKQCDEYWAKSRKCNDKMLAAVPAGAARDQMKKALEDAEKQTREAWKAMPSAALESACKQMSEALKQNPTCKD